MTGSEPEGSIEKVVDTVDHSMRRSESDYYR
jgi:hypothetical protein